MQLLARSLGEVRYAETVVLRDFDATAGPSSRVSSTHRLRRASAFPSGPSASPELTARVCGVETRAVAARNVGVPAARGLRGSSSRRWRSVAFREYPRPADPRAVGAVKGKLAPVGAGTAS